MYMNISRNLQVLHQGVKTCELTANITFPPFFSQKIMIFRYGTLTATKFLAEIFFRRKNIFFTFLHFGLLNCLDPSEVLWDRYSA